MRAKFVFVPLVILGLLSGSFAQSTDPEFIEGKVIIVPDGDEVRVKTSDGKAFTVRIHGIDAPESKQDFGNSARKDLEARVLDKDVKVIVHRKDSQGRYMGTVFFEGQDIGVRLLENGSAWHYKRVSGEQSSEARVRYAKAELKARESKLGLWASAMPMPPWEFREEQEDGANATKSETAATQAPVQIAASASSNPETSQPPADPGKANDGRTYVLGPRGGCYYLNSSGSKVYVKDKSRCNKP
ncbi:MAG: thermonuclease family protein [Pyrinomonadaceae bacterium]